MPNCEISILNPGRNPDGLHTYTSGGFFDPGHPYFDIHQILVQQLKTGLELQEKRPEDITVVELCAGNGPFAQIYALLGVKPNNIYCIDQALPDEFLPLNAHAQWRYWDLEYLGLCLQNQIPLPEEVKALRGCADILILHQEPERISPYAPNFAEFFGKSSTHMVGVSLYLASSKKTER